jgi:hypothetical protein
LIHFQFDRKELAAKNPPTSLVPRLHVLSFAKLEAGNPLLQNPTDAKSCNIDLVSANSHFQLSYSCKNFIICAISCIKNESTVSPILA